MGGICMLFAPFGFGKEISVSGNVMFC